MRNSSFRATSHVLDRFEHLLVPLNFSDNNEIALQTALDIASSAPSRVTLLHVIEPIDLPEDSGVQNFTEQLRTRADEKLGQRAQRFSDHNVTVGCENLVGKRAKEIVRFARDNAVDLIILNSHKIQANEPEKELASLSYQVTVLSRCSVLLLK
jgi:universal stress protein A